MDVHHLLQVPQRNIAHPEQTRAAGIPLPPHRFPDFGVRIAPAVAGGRPVQHVAVDMISPEMFKRTGQRLCDLH